MKTESAIATPLWSKAFNSIKAVAILLVIYNHFWIYPLILDLGDLGVDLFFILSGITLTISQKQRERQSEAEPRKTQWIKWYQRRFLHLYPKFWVASIIKVCVIYILYEFWISFDQFIVHLSGFQSNPLFPDVFYLVDNPHWFLSVLLLGYTFFPLIYKITEKNWKGWLIVLIVIYSVMVTFAQNLFIYNQQLILQNFKINLSSDEYYLYYYRLFDIPLGVIFGQIFGQEPKKIIAFYSKPRSIVVIIILNCVVFSGYGIYRSFISFDWGELRLIYFPGLTFCFFNLLMVIFIGAVNLNKIFEPIGKISFDLYLLHYMIYEIILITIIQKQPITWGYIYFIHILILLFDFGMARGYAQIWTKFEHAMDQSQTIQIVVLSILYTIILFSAFSSMLFLSQVDILAWSSWIFSCIFCGILAIVLILSLLKIKRNAKNFTSIQTPIAERNPYKPA